MNGDQLEGNWGKLKAKVKQQWGKLTNDQLDVIESNPKASTGIIHEAHGLSKDEAEKQISEWEKSLINTKRDL